MGERITVKFEFGTYHRNGTTHRAGLLKVDTGTDEKIIGLPFLRKQTGEMLLGTLDNSLSAEKIDAALREIEKEKIPESESKELQSLEEDLQDDYKRNRDGLLVLVFGTKAVVPVPLSCLIN